MTVSKLFTSGNTKITMLVEAARLWVFRLGSIFVLKTVFHMGVESIILNYPVPELALLQLV